MNRALSILAVIGALLCGADVAQAAVRLKADATGLNDGTSWANAFTNAHDAVAAAIEGDGIVYAAGGKYVCTDKFTVARDFAIYGGFAGASESETLDDRDSAAHPTVFTGDVKGDDKWSHKLEGATKATTGSFIWAGMTFAPPPENSIYCMPTVNNTDDTVAFVVQTSGDLLLDGVTLTGFKEETINFSGGGTFTFKNSLFLANGTGITGAKRRYSIKITSSAMVASGCSFIGNGQGVYQDTSLASSFSDCLFSYTYVKDGCAGSVCAKSGKVTMTDCTVRRSYFTDTGHNYEGACVFAAVNAELTRCVFEENRGINGCVRMCAINSAIVDDCVFRRNYRKGACGSHPSGALFCDGNNSQRIVKNCLFEGNTNEVTDASQDNQQCAPSCIVNYWGSLAVLNCTFRDNVSICAEGALPIACTVGGMNWLNAGKTIMIYNSMAIANCVFTGSVLMPGTTGRAGEIACNENGTAAATTIGIANTVAWNEAEGYVPLLLDGGKVPDVVNSALKNFDATDYELGAQDFMENIYTVADPLEGAVLVEKEGHAPQLKLAAQSPLARKGRPIYLKDKTPYIYWDSTETDKPWYNLVDKSMKAKALSGFTKDGPYAADAFGADRKAHSALGPLNTDPLGLLMLVR